MQRRPSGALLAMILLLAAKASWAQFGRSSYNGSDVRWTVWLGGGENHRVPSGTLVPHMSFDILSLEYGKFVSPRTSIGCELSLSEQLAGGDNAAASILGNYRHYFLVRGRFAADYAVGIGFMHMHDGVSGQATKSNFNEQLSVGLHYATGSASTVSVEYRLNHASNAGLERPNHGINATAVVIGYSWYR